MLEIAPELLVKIQNNGEKAYPEEGAGFLLGVDGEIRRVLSLLPLPLIISAAHAADMTIRGAGAARRARRSHVP